MKAFLLVISLLLSLPSWANKTGVGVSLGNPTGLNGKYWLDSSKAIDAGFAFSLGGHSKFGIHSDYLFHNDGAFYLNDTYPLDLYFGIGGRMKFSDDIEIGARVPVGLASKFENDSADMFLEVAPIFDFISKTGIELHLLFGSRYYF